MKIIYYLKKRSWNLFAYKPKLKIYLMAILLLSCTAMLLKDIKVDQTFAFAEKQTALMLKAIDAYMEGSKSENKKSEPVSPRTIENGELVMVPSRDWTSGFFPGELWYLYEYTKDQKWLKEAQKFTAKLEPEKWNGKTHDMGFKIYCSYGNGYRLTKDETYKDIIIQSAKTLCTRFNPKTAVIRSWDHNQDKWINPVIIDNMMNLELLFAATRFTGDSSFYHIAVSHANTTMKNHFRPDYSSYHVLDYDPQTGEVLKKNTHQGNSHESSWARGQAWAIYGFTMCYRETKDRKYLELAQRAADYFLTQINKIEDNIPYWDFSDPAIPKVSRDASAAAVAASAMIELSQWSEDKRYFTGAEQMLQSLNSEEYLAEPGTNGFFLLKHSTGHKPHNSEIDVPIVYADYYFLEALMRYKSHKEK
ncbi:MAG TPA: glycoside hydrolase family 88 protein [Cytophagales bacterium]|nr:glycoside hydrolase family 88 protein [Cytophagales bacterium]